LAQKLKLASTLELKPYKSGIVFLSQFVSMIYHTPKLNSCLMMIYQYLIIMTAATAAISHRRIGSAPPCVNANKEDYKVHRMRTVYMRSSMIAGRRGRNSRSMIPIGYYCFKCEKFWVDDDLMDMI
jgi:hypothetical protein